MAISYVWYVWWHHYRCTTMGIGVDSVYHRPEQWWHSSLIFSVIIINACVVVGPILLLQWYLQSWRSFIPVVNIEHACCGFEIPYYHTSWGNRTNQLRKQSSWTKIRYTTPCNESTGVKYGAPCDEITIKVTWNSWHKVKNSR